MSLLSSGRVNSLLPAGNVRVKCCKGFDRWSDDDAKEKRAVGHVWEAKSNGQCIFVMPEGPDWNAILAKSLRMNQERVE